MTSPIDTHHAMARLKDRSAAPDLDHLADSAEPLAIDHPPLSTVVADSLRKLIAAGKLAPGARLNEREL